MAGGGGGEGGVGGAQLGGNISLIDGSIWSPKAVLVCRSVNLVFI